MSNIKQELHKLCISIIKERIDNAQHSLDELQQATENETKSSAGDKYETSREMMQQDTDRCMAMLNEARKQMVALNLIGTNASAETVDNGSLVITNNGNFYLTISAGALQYDNQKYFAVSVASPVGARLKGKKVGDSVSFNNNNYLILEIV